MNATEYMTQCLRNKVNINSLGLGSVDDQKVILTEWIDNREKHAAEIGDTIDSLLSDLVLNGTNLSAVENVCDNAFQVLEDGRIVQFELVDHGTFDLRIWCGESYEDVPLSIDALGTVKADLSSSKSAALLSLRDILATGTDETLQFFDYMRNVLNALGNDSLGLQALTATGLQSAVSSVRDLALMVTSSPAEDRARSVVQTCLTSLFRVAGASDAAIAEDPDAGGFQISEYEGVITKGVFQGAWSIVQTAATAIFSIMMICGGPVVKTIGAAGSAVMSLISWVKDRVDSTESITVGNSASAYEFSNATRIALPGGIGPISSPFWAYDGHGDENFDACLGNSAFSVMNAKKDTLSGGWTDLDRDTHIHNALLYPKAYQLCYRNASDFDLMVRDTVGDSGALYPRTGSLNSHFSWNASSRWGSIGDWTTWWQAHDSENNVHFLGNVVQNILPLQTTASFTPDDPAGQSAISSGFVHVPNVQQRIAQDQAAGKLYCPWLEAADLTTADGLARSQVLLNWLEGMYGIASQAMTNRWLDVSFVDGHLHSGLYGAFLSADHWYRAGASTKVPHYDLLGAVLADADVPAATRSTWSQDRQNRYLAAWTAREALWWGLQVILGSDDAVDDMKDWLSRYMGKHITSNGLCPTLSSPGSRLNWPVITKLIDGDLSYAHWDLTFPSSSLLSKFMSKYNNLSASDFENWVASSVSGAEIFILLWATALEMIMVTNASDSDPHDDFEFYAASSLSAEDIADTFAYAALPVVYGFIDMADWFSGAAYISDNTVCHDAPHIITDAILTPPKFSRGTALTVIALAATIAAVTVAAALVTSKLIRRATVAKIARREGEAKRAAERLWEMDPKTTDPEVYHQAVKDYSKAQRRFQRYANFIGYSSNNVATFASGQTDGLLNESLLENLSSFGAVDTAELSASQYTAMAEGVNLDPVIDLIKGYPETSPVNTSPLVDMC